MYIFLKCPLSHVHTQCDLCTRDYEQVERGIMNKRRHGCSRSKVLGSVGFFYDRLLMCPYGLLELRICFISGNFSVTHIMMHIYCISNNCRHVQS